MRITMINKNVSKGKIKIILDNDESILISEDVFFDKNLYEDKEISQDEIEYLKFDCSKRLAKLTAIKFLILKLRTNFEVFNNLKQKGFSEEIIEIVIKDLEMLGYLNDKIYVEKYIKDCENLRAISLKKIEYNLLKKGIKRDLIETLIYMDEDVEFKKAFKISENKFEKLKSDKDLYKKKLFNFLKNRGFNYKTIKRVYDELTENKD
ncbi:MAG: regulatory protein RecX [Clostridiales bacterium]